MTAAIVSDIIKIAAKRPELWILPTGWPDFGALVLITSWDRDLGAGDLWVFAMKRKKLAVCLTDAAVFNVDAVNSVKSTAPYSLWNFPCARSLLLCWKCIRLHSGSIYTLLDCNTLQSTLNFTLTRTLATAFRMIVVSRVLTLFFLRS